MELDACPLGHAGVNQTMSFLTELLKDYWIYQVLDVKFDPSDSM